MKYKIKIKNEKTPEGLPSIIVVTVVGVVVVIEVVVVVDIVVVVDELAVRTAWKSTT